MRKGQSNVGWPSLALMVALLFAPSPANAEDQIAQDQPVEFPTTTILSDLSINEHFGLDDSQHFSLQYRLENGLPRDVTVNAFDENTGAFSSSRGNCFYIGGRWLCPVRGGSGGPIGPLMPAPPENLVLEFDATRSDLLGVGILDGQTGERVTDLTFVPMQQQMETMVGQ